MAKAALSAIDRIRAARSQVLDSMDAAIDKGVEELMVASPPYSGYLITLLADLQREKSRVDHSLTDEILALPEVIAAVGTLEAVAKSAKKEAALLPQVTKGLVIAGKILGLAQQYANLLATARS